MAEQIEQINIIPNMNPNMVIGIWFEATKAQGASFETHPIIAFMYKTVIEQNISEVALMTTVLTPASPGGIGLHHPQARLYDKSSGSVYNREGDPDIEIMKYISNVAKMGSQQAKH